MVRPRRLAHVKIPELEEAIEKAKAQGFTTLPSPNNDKEWQEFEDLYFELKEKLNYKPDSGQLGNSLSDLTTLLWVKRTKDVYKEEEGVVFVTLNLSLLKVKETILKDYGVKVLTALELMDAIDEEKT